jgi:hypothetical protein
VERTDIDVERSGRFRRGVEARVFDQIPRDPEEFVTYLGGKPRGTRHAQSVELADAERGVSKREADIPRVDEKRVEVVSYELNLAEDTEVDVERAICDEEQSDDYDADQPKRTSVRQLAEPCSECRETPTVYRQERQDSDRREDPRTATPAGTGRDDRVNIREPEHVRHADNEPRGHPGQGRH